jgi:phage shock protein A
MTDNERMAVLETKVQHLSDQLDDTHKKVDETNKKLDEVIALFNQARGARWAIVAMAGLGGALAAFAVKFVAGLAAFAK